MDYSKNGLNAAEWNQFETLMIKSNLAQKIEMLQIVGKRMEASDLDCKVSIIIR